MSDTKSFARPQNIALGITLIITAALAISVQDVIFKIFSSEMTLWQIFALRGCIAVPLLIAICWAQNPQFADVVRGHWAIENTLHWSLDMTYREDESRVRDRNFAQNLSWIRRLTLSLIKQHPGKESYAMKRRMAAWSVDFMMQLLTGQTI